MAKATQDDIYQFNRIKAALAEKVGRPKLENNTMLRMMMDFTEDALNNDRFEVRTNFDLDETDSGS